jgi:hypothetical protein
MEVSLGSFMKGKVSSGVFCSVCGSEMVYINHGGGCFRLCLVCAHVELHDKIVDGVNFHGKSVFRLVSDEELRLKFSNVLGLFLVGGEVLPFKVRRVSWADGSYFIVRKVVVRAFGLGGVLCGEAFGCFLDKRSRACDVRLRKLGRADCYEWVRV